MSSSSTCAQDVHEQSFPHEQSFTVFAEMARRHATQAGFIDVHSPSAASLLFVKLHPGTGDVLFKLTVNNDKSWRLLYQDKIVKCTDGHHILSMVPSTLNVESFISLVNKLSTCIVCNGHDDMIDIIKHYKAINETNLYNVTKTAVVGFLHCNTIRSIDCTFVIAPGSGTRCVSCKQLRSNLRARASHIRNKSNNTDKTSASSKVPVSKLSDSEKNERLKNLSKAVRRISQKCKKSTVDLDEKDVLNVDDKKHDVLFNIAKEQTSSIEESFPVGSPERIFWEQQLKTCKVKSAKGMRWHPLIIKWCLSLFSKSPSAYEQLSQAGFIQMPSKSTLKSYMRFTDSVPDINPEILELLCQEFNLTNPESANKHVALVWDEVRIKSGLAVSKKTGKLVGFCHIENSDMDYEKLFGNACNSTEPEVATHLMVLMVRGICSHVNIPFLWYPCKTFTSLQLTKIIWDATQCLEDLDLKVRAWVCDGATTNRTFFGFHNKLGLQYNGVTYCTLNRCDNSRYIYFICDVPHLLKTVRNNLENSHGHSSTKSLIKGGRAIKWSHIVNTVKSDKALDLNKLYKIKEEHIQLSPQLRMRVRLAAQVLSSTMNNALLSTNNPDFIGTAEFCNIFNKWFDCLNGRYLWEGMSKRNPDLEPYKDVSDPRFHWLQTFFLGWLEEWETEVNSLTGLSKHERNKLILAKQTMNGLKITTNSFINLGKQLLDEPGVEYLLPEKLNQDRLETYFSKLRRGSGDSDNPTVDQARHRMLTLLVAGKSFLPPKNRNCEAVDDGVNIALPKRKKQKKNKI